MRAIGRLANILNCDVFSDLGYVQLAASLCLFECEPTTTSYLGTRSAWLPENAYHIRPSSRGYGQISQRCGDRRWCSRSLTPIDAGLRLMLDKKTQPWVIYILLEYNNREKLHEDPSETIEETVLNQIPLTKTLNLKMTPKMMIIWRCEHSSLIYSSKSKS